MCATESVKENVVRIEYDVLDNVVRSMKAAPYDAYWARRLLDLIRDPVAASRYKHEIARAVSCWAMKDPSFFIHEQYLSEQLAVWAWPKSVLEEIDANLRVGRLGAGPQEREDDSLRHFIMGRLWLEARRPPEDMPDFYARAARHLREVEPRLQVGAWHEAFCESLGVADPDELARRAGDILVSAAPAARDRAVVAILRGAARTANWELYDEHRRNYGIFDPESSRMNSEIIRYDGLRAEHAVTEEETAKGSLTPPKVPTFKSAPMRPRISRGVFEAITVRPKSNSEGRG
jgi:hypothetical protein